MEDNTNKNLFSHTSVCLENMYYNDNDILKKIPYWFKFFFTLGLATTTFNESSKRFVIAIAIPSRPYASLLIAAGLILGRSILPNERTNQNYKDYILSLDQDTPVIFRDGDKKLKALIDHNHPRFYEGKEIIGLKIEKRSTKYIDINLARQITIDNRVSNQLPENQKGRKIDPPCLLLKAMIGNGAENYNLESRIETLIVGQMNNLKEESKLWLSLRQNGNENCPGQLYDIIKPYSPHSLGLAYRSLILPTKIQNSPKLSGEEKPFAVILDGAQSYFNWKEMSADINQIIVLDKTERNFRYAVEQINNSDYVNRSENPIKINIPQGLSGIEVMVFGVDK